MCILNYQLVHDDIYPERFGKLQGMVKDPVRGSIWTYTNKAVFKHTVFREARSDQCLCVPVHYILRT